MTWLAPGATRQSEASGAEPCEMATNYAVIIVGYFTKSTAKFAFPLELIPMGA